jgi:iron complex outermembrane recepter protein
MARYRRIAVVAIGASLPVGLASLGLGQSLAPGNEPSGSSESTMVEEIVVTAQKRSQNLQDVPVSINAISGTTLAQAGVDNTQQLSVVVPGLELSANGSQLEPHLRGIGTTASGPGNENSVAIYVDDVYIASQSATLLQLNNISQVAVLKGPQGTLFGRNATGGVIQVTTSDPTGEFRAEVGTSLDNFFTTRSDMYVAGPLTSSLDADISAEYAYQGVGWGQNLDTGEDIDRIKRDIILRSKWIWAPADDTKIKVIFDYSDQLDNMSSNNFIPYPGTGVAFLGSVRPSDPWNIDDYGSNISEFRGGGVSAEMQQGLGVMRLASITAYRKDGYDWGFEYTESPTPGEHISIDNPTEELTQEFHLSSLENSRVTWVAGLFYFYDSSSSSPTDVGLAGPYSAALGGLSNVEVLDTQRANSAAAFGQASAEVLPQTNLTLGARYTYERRNFSGFEEGFVSTDISIGPISPYYREYEISHSPTWRVALDHRFDSDLMAYVSYNRGFKSGGFNGFDPTNPPYQPETLNAYEAGIKSELMDRRLRVNAAAFLYNYSNIQISRYDIVADVYNGASARIYGVDLDWDARMTPALSLTGGMEWLHSEFLDFPLAQFSTPLPGGGDRLYLASAAGNQLPFAPSFTLSLGANYKMSLDRSAFTFDVTNYLNSGYFAEPSNYLRQPAYDYLNASLSWSPDDSGLTLKAFANNLLDKAVATQIGTSSFEYFETYANPPRVYGFSVTYKFR